MAVVAVAGLSLAACNGKADSKERVEDKTSDNTEMPGSNNKEAVSAVQNGIDLDKLQAEYTVIDFNAVWCGPCKQFAPVFEAAAEKYEDIDFVSIDVDEYPEIAERFGVESIPMVVILNSDGEVIGENIGYMDADDFETFLASEEVI